MLKARRSREGSLGGLALATERRGHATELDAQLRADGRKYRSDGHRYEGRDQPVFDSCRRGFIAKESQEQRHVAVFYTSN